MSEDERNWREDADRNGWVMPCAVWWKRLPVIRHVRAAIHRHRALKYRHLTRAAGLGLGGLPQFDRWVLYGIARGYERPTGGGRA
jgi:hypothetical protein